MSTIELKTSLHKLIDTIQDSKTLQAIHTLLSKEAIIEADWWNEISDKEKASIERGLKDVKAGRVYTHEQVMGKSKALISKYKKQVK